MKKISSIALIFLSLTVVHTPSLASSNKAYDHDKESLADSIARLEKFTRDVQKGIDSNNKDIDRIVEDKTLSEKFRKPFGKLKRFARADNGEDEFLDASAKFCANVIIIQDSSFQPDSKVDKYNFERCMKSFIDHRTYMFYTNYFVKSRVKVVEEPPKPWMWPFNQSHKTDME